MNIELSVKEENGIVKIKITSADMPVVMETVTGQRSADTAVPATPVQKDATTSETEAGTSEAGRKTVSALSEKITLLNREYERIRKAVYRAKKKLADTVVPRVPESYPAPVPCVPEAVPGDNVGQGTENTAYRNTCNTKTISKTKSMTSSDNNLSDNNLSQSNRFLPLTTLPEAYRNVVDAWNHLPLRSKLKGLYPDVAVKLRTTLEKYGEASLRKAIRMVADSPFLLGKSNHSSGWVICFSWLLKPGNLQKVLDNKYRNREQDWEQNYYGASFPDYSPWTDAETCYLDPCIMTEGLTTLNEHTQSCLEQAARTLGLKKEAVA